MQDCFFINAKGNICGKGWKVYKTSSSPSVENASIPLLRDKEQDMSLATAPSDSICPSAPCLRCNRTMFWEGEKWSRCKRCKCLMCIFKEGLPAPPADCWAQVANETPPRLFANKKAQGQMEAGWLLSGTKPQLSWEHPRNWLLPPVCLTVSGRAFFITVCNKASQLTFQTFQAGCSNDLL